MPSLPDKRACNYPERIHERLSGALQAALEAVPVSKCGPKQKCGITREMIGKVERRERCVIAALSPSRGSAGLFSRRRRDSPIQDCG